MQIYFKTRQAARNLSTKRRANGKPAKVIDLIGYVPLGQGMSRYAVDLKGAKL
jgi:hypothetical protein